MTSEFPIVKQEPYLVDHADAKHIDEAHPLSTAIVNEATTRPETLPAELAAIQAVADKHIDELGTPTLVDSDGTTEYYYATSDTFYRLATRVRDTYASTYISIDRLHAIVAAHTRQFLADLHGYDGDFGGHEPTLCNALNEPSVQEGAVRNETVPDDVRYGFVDARGLVVERGTHTGADG